MHTTHEGTQQVEHHGIQEPSLSSHCPFVVFASLFVPRLHPSLLTNIASPPPDPQLMHTHTHTHTFECRCDAHTRTDPHQATETCQCKLVNSNQNSRPPALRASLSIIAAVTHGLLGRSIDRDSPPSARSSARLSGADISARFDILIVTSSFKPPSLHPQLFRDLGRRRSTREGCLDSSNICCPSPPDMREDVIFAGPGELQVQR